MMDCLTWQERLVDFLAGELSEEKAILLEQHLAECNGCSDVEHELRELFSQAQASEEWAPAPEMEERLLSVMRRIPREGPQRVPAAASSSQVAPALVENPAAHTSFLARGLRAFLRPIPAYAAVLILLITSSGAFWVGQIGGNGESSTGIGDGALALSQSSHLGGSLYSGDRLRSSSPRAEGVELATALAHWQDPSPPSRFEPAPSDAIQIPGRVFGDSL